jgi:hypothetical protein
LGDFPFAFDLSDSTHTAKVSRLFNSKEKRLVRNKLWLPIYRKVCGNAIPVGKIKYLCFPGLGCSFIKQLLGLHLISPDQTTVVALEPEKNWHKDIFEYFAKTFELGKYEVLEGNYEDLIGEKRLIHWFFEPPYGFDILELDFPVPLFSLGSDKESKLLESIAKTMKLQAFLGKSFYIITSFKAENKISRDLRTTYGNSVKMLSKEILEKENSLLNDETLSSLIASLAVDANKFNQEKCSLFAIPLAIIRRSEGICTVKLDQAPYTHVSKSVGGKTRIISYVFWCEPRAYAIDCAGDTLFKETKENIHKAIRKIEQTVWMELE